MPQSLGPIVRSARRALVVSILLTLLALPSHAQWTTATHINTNVTTMPWVNDAPVMVRQGTANFVAWSASGSVYLQRLDGGGVPASSDVLVGVGDEPVLASDGAGGVVIAWTSIDTIYAQRYDATLTPQWFGGPYAVAPGGGDQSTPRLVADGSHVVAAWLDTAGGSTGVHAQKLDVAWGQPQWSPASTGLALHVNTSSARTPAILPSGSLLWAAWESGGDLYLRHVDPSGSGGWTAEFAIATTPGKQNLPQLVDDGAGGVIVGWFDHASSQRLLIQRFSAQVWPPEVWSPSSGLVLGTSVWSIEPPNRVFSMDTDNAGGAVVAWSRDSNIRYQRVFANGSLDWGSNGAQLTSNGGFYIQNVAPMLRSDGQSGAILAWHSRHKTWDDYGDILAQRIHINHGPSWTAGGKVVSDAPGSQSEVFVTTRNHCPSYFVWRDVRPDDGLYAHRFRCPGLPHRVAIAADPKPIFHTHDRGRWVLVAGTDEVFDDGLRTGRLTVVWDGEVLELDEAVTGETLGDQLSVEIVEAASGRVEIQLDGEATPAAGDALLELVFQTHEAGSTAVTIPLAVLDDEPVAATAGTVTVLAEDADR
ncbi:MAG: hypothetical protein AAGC60_08165 [Acidobacteriota bacterium]